MSDENEGKPLAKTQSRNRFGICGFRHFRERGSSPAFNGALRLKP